MCLPLLDTEAEARPATPPILADLRQIVQELSNGLRAWWSELYFTALVDHQLLTPPGCRRRPDTRRTRPCSQLDSRVLEAETLAAWTSNRRQSPRHPGPRLRRLRRPQRPLRPRSP